MNKNDRYALRFIDPELKVKLEKLAALDDRSLNLYINRVLTEHVKRDVFTTAIL